MFLDLVLVTGVCEAVCHNSLLYTFLYALFFVCIIFWKRHKMKTQSQDSGKYRSCKRSHRALSPTALDVWATP